MYAIRAGVAYINYTKSLLMEVDKKVNTRNYVNTAICAVNLAFEVNVLKIQN